MSYYYKTGKLRFKYFLLLEIFPNGSKENSVSTYVNIRALEEYQRELLLKANYIIYIVHWLSTFAFFCGYQPTPPEPTRTSPPPKRHTHTTTNTKTQKLSASTQNTNQTSVVYWP